MTIQRETVPPRGTRPRNRRALILSAATDLFHAHGYDQVSMSDVAAAVNVRPSALYRHFAGKPQLFTAALLEEMAPIRQLLTELANTGADLPAVGRGLAAATIGRSRLGLLWQREARALPADEFQRLRTEIVTSVTMLADLITARRPELARKDAKLLSSCAYSVLCSVSYHPEELPRGQYEHVLGELLLTVLSAQPAPAQRPTEPPPAGLRPVARRERLLHAAITLFAERGYAAVSMEDIGARAGIAGASIYYHFDSKQRLLAAALDRGDEWLRHDMYRALAGATDATHGLHRLVRSYIDFAVEHNASLDILLTEARHLDGEQRAATKQAQREYLGEWIHLMRTCQPALGETEGKVRAHAVLTMINDVARTPRLRTQPSALQTLDRIATTVLIPRPTPSTP